MTIRIAETATKFSEKQAVFPLLGHNDLHCTIPRYNQKYPLQTEELPYFVWLSNNWREYLNVQMHQTAGYRKIFIGEEFLMDETTVGSDCPWLESGDRHLIVHEPYAKRKPFAIGIWFTQRMEPFNKNP